MQLVLCYSLKLKESFEDETFLVYLKYVNEDEFNNVRINKTILTSLGQQM